jgi:hypothetical protein
VPTDTVSLQECTGAITSSALCTVPTNRESLRLYRCHNKIRCMHCAYWHSQSPTVYRCHNKIRCMQCAYWHSQSPRVYRCHNKLRCMHCAYWHSQSPRLYRGHNKLRCMHCAYWHSLQDCTGAITSSAACIVPTDTVSFQNCTGAIKTPQYALCLLTSRCMLCAYWHWQSPKLCRYHNKLSWMHSAYWHSRYINMAHSFHSVTGPCPNEVS